ncbi:ATP-grasp domain-containing protein [Methanococcus maripaludis]|uniref:Alpha-aminoadipate--LysW ligase LysX n=1 Tax=Methanococcus maripaludis TaxID=39152 RepID=A0A2L1CB76_METMI|nr:RimK family alpha-L-glutamate ligase [Methanococcus maripaludis]AVB76617.1 Alpha-aminoadipate--LysW ligase LysX [Methanococcus maripaludis]MBA2863126.1 ribosomal protein S6--L-glutamate ligase [Methanococcus maripaludis]MBB6496869.1 ribosomal protein S6--L-glutamate ligase [Methanococcus maripaludis]
MKIGILAHKKTPENTMIFEELKKRCSVEFIGPLNVFLGSESYDFDLILSRVERDFLIEGIYALKDISKDIPVINSAETIQTCQNKYLTYLKLKKVSPKSFLTYSKDISEIFDKIDNNFGYPCVLKPIYGGYGDGVLKVTSKSEFVEVFEKNEKNELFVQEFVPYIHDIRVFLVNNEIIGSMERIPKNSWKANYSLGAEIKEFKLSNEVEDMVLDSVKKLGADIVGIDVLISNDKNYILEANITPQFRGMMNFVNVPEKIADYCINYLK